MVTNLPAEAKAKWIKVMEARTVEEKIQALEEFLSSVPKHKGTEKLRLWATRRLAELREELEEKKRKKSGRSVSFFVEKEGAAQIAVVGLPNSGKSLLVHKLTGAKTVVSEHPFSTLTPVPGMLKYQDVLFQLIDLPPLQRGSALYSRVIGIVRNADGLMIVLNAENNILNEFFEIKSILEDAGIVVKEPRGRVVLESYRTGKSGIRVTMMGKLLDCTLEDVKKLLESYRIYNAHVKIYGEVTLDNIEQAIFENILYKPAIVFVNKVDIRDPAEEVEQLSNQVPIEILKGSAARGDGLENVGKALFAALKIIRIYTKSPNGPVSDKPLILKEGATVEDVAESIHRDFVEKFRFARVWGSSAKYPGERVGLGHVLKDGDIVEIHIKG